ACETGRWVRIKQRVLLWNLNNLPVSRAKEASQRFLTALNPPRLTRRGKLVGSLTSGKLCYFLTSFTTSANRFTPSAICAGVSAQNGNLRNLSPPPFGKNASPSARFRFFFAAA